MDNNSHGCPVFPLRLSVVPYLFRSKAPCRRACSIRLQRASADRHQAVVPVSRHRQHHPGNSAGHDASLFHHRSDVCLCGNTHSWCAEPVLHFGHRVQVRTHRTIVVDNAFGCSACWHNSRNPPINNSQCPTLRHRLVHDALWCSRMYQCHENLSCQKDFHTLERAGAS